MTRRPLSRCVSLVSVAFAAVFVWCLLVIGAAVALVRLAFKLPMMVWNATAGKGGK